MTISSTTTESDNILQQNIVAQAKNDSTHKVNVPEPVSHKEPVSEIENEASVRLTQQKSEPQSHDHHGHSGYQRRRWGRHYKYYIALPGGMELSIKLVLIVVIMIGVIAGTLKVVPSAFHHGNNSTTFPPGATATTAATRLGTVTEFPIPDASNIAKITSGPDGNLWFTELTKNKISAIGRITVSGTVTEFLLPPPVHDLDFSEHGITSGPNSNLWFTEANYDSNGNFISSAIGRITPAGTITEFPIPPDPNSNGLSPSEITSGSDGNLWFVLNAVPGTGKGADKIGRITPAGTITEFGLFPTFTPPYCDLSGITSGPDGNLWFILNCLNSPVQIGSITPAGTITEFTVPAPSNVLTSITSGSDGNLWFTSDNVGAPAFIGRITPIGTITQFPIPPDPHNNKNSPSEITSGRDGNLWFTNTTYGSIDQIVRITTAGKFTGFPLLNLNNAAFGITSGPDGNLWFTETKNDSNGNFISSAIGRITTGK